MLARALSPVSTRSLLFAVGVAALVGSAAWLGVQGPARATVQGAVLATGVLALFGAALLPKRPGLGGFAGACAGLAAWLAASWAYATVSFPYVDPYRPWGMDWSPTPVARPAVILLLLLFALPRALGPAGSGRLPARILAFLACAGLVTWWSVERWYEMDLIAQEGVVPFLASHLPPPGRVGAGDTPAVLGGKLVHLHWTQYAYPSMPLTGLWYTLHRELAVGALAHGLHLELAESLRASGALDAATASRHASVRAMLWAAQRGATSAWLYAHVALVPIAAVTALRMFRRAPGPAWATRVAWALRAVLYATPVVNVLLLGAAKLTGLPDVRSGAGRVLVESLATVLAVWMVDRSGGAWLAGARVPEGGEVGRGPLGERGASQASAVADAAPSEAPSPVPARDAPPTTGGPRPDEIEQTDEAPPSRTEAS